MTTRLQLMATGVLSVGSLVASTTSSSSGEVTFQLKGSPYSVSGTVVGFDGATYIVETANLGKVELKAQKFDCRGADCPTAAMTASPAQAAPPPAEIQAAPARSGAPASSTTASLAAGAPSPHPVPKITLSGSPTLASALMPALIEAYAANKGGKIGSGGGGTTEVTAGVSRLRVFAGDQTALADFELRSSDPARAFTDLERGSAQIALTTRPIEEGEARRLAIAGQGNFREPSHEHVIGFEGLMAQVGPNSPAVAMSIETLAQILAGTLTDWSQLGLPASPISVILAPLKVGSSSDTLANLLVGERGSTLSPRVSTTNSLAQFTQRVSTTPGALGITGLTRLAGLKPLTVETSCGLIVKPSVFEVKTEEYPLSRPLYSYTAGALSDPVARDFFTFLKSPAASKVIEGFDLADQRIDLLSFANQTDRIAYALNAAPEDFDFKLMQSLIADLKPYSRLSVTFRFQGGSDRLTAKGMEDTTKLSAFLASPEAANKRVVLVGFSDAKGTFATNLRLAQRRTAAVAREVVAAGRGALDPARITTRTYGKLAPVSCNDSALHRQLNRRVEVWIEK